MFFLDLVPGTEGTYISANEATFGDLWESVKNGDIVCVRKYDHIDSPFDGDLYELTTFVMAVYAAEPGLYGTTIMFSNMSLVPVSETPSKDDLIVLTVS